MGKSMTTTPIPAPLSADELAALTEKVNTSCSSFGWATLDFSVDSGFNIDPDNHYGRGTLRLLATLTAKEEIIAGLTAERDALSTSLTVHVSIATAILARAETAESRVTVLEGALRPFATFAEGLHKAIPDGIPMTQGSPMARKQLTAGDLRRAAAALTPSDQVERT